MFDFVLCYSRADAPVAARIVQRLSLVSDRPVTELVCEGAPGETLDDLWEDAHDAQAVLLLVSDAAVRNEAPQKAWRACLEHYRHRNTPDLGVVLIDDTRCPPVLENRAGRHLWRWSAEPVETLREIERWALSYEPPSVEPLALAAVSSGAASQEITHRLKPLLLDRPAAVCLHADDGVAAAVAAQAFARSVQEHFRRVVWLPAGPRSSTSVVYQLASDLGISCELPAGEMQQEWERVLRRERWLIVIEDLHEDLPLAYPEAARSSVLLLPSAGLRERNGSGLDGAVDSVRLDISPAVAVTKTPDQLTEDELRLLNAFAISVQPTVSLDLAIIVSNLFEPLAREAAASLVQSHWLSILDDQHEIYRVHSRVTLDDLSATALRQLRDRHAETLCGGFIQRRARPDRCLRLLSEVEQSLEWACSSNWQLAVRLGQNAAGFLRSERRWEECVELYQTLLAEAQKRGHEDTMADCRRELSWLRDSEGTVRAPETAGEQLGFDFSASLAG